VKAKLGLHTPLDTDDRHILEDVIIPYFVSRPPFEPVLFVGCDWYTRHYERLFQGKEYWTIDKDPTRSQYGGRRHITDSLMNLGRHFEADHFGLIICNGVLGWGLEEKTEVEDSFEACARCLRHRGVLVLGWNDIPEKLPFPLEHVKSLAGLQRYTFPPLSSSKYLTRTSNRHTFSFYAKEPNASKAP